MTGLNLRFLGWGIAIFDGFWRLNLEDKWKAASRLEYGLYNKQNFLNQWVVGSGMLQEKMNNFGKRKSDQSIAKSQVSYPINMPLKAIAALLLLLTPAPILTSEAAIAQTLAQTLAQTATPPVLPDSLPKDSKLTIDGSGSLAAVNQALKEKFSAKYANTPLTFSTNGSAAGLKALVDNQVDLAAIGRRLTDAEKAQGLVEILIKREKIAMLVSEGNPFTGSLTIRQFAKIFRGEVTDWSEVGGKPGAIRLVDQPETSDTRNAFPNYPVFKEASFKAVANATQVGDENPETIASKLGEDGISYITADGVKNIKGVRAVQMHETLPDNPLYPFSQPIAYVYKKGKLSPATLAFLSYVSGDDAKAAIQSVSSPGAEIIDTKEAIAGAIAQSTATAVPSTASTASPVAAVPNAAPATTPIAVTPAMTPAVAPPVTPSEGGGFPWWWLLLPLGLLGLWGLKGLFGAKEDAIDETGIPTAGTNGIGTTGVSTTGVSTTNVPPVVSPPVVTPNDRTATIATTPAPTADVPVVATVDSVPPVDPVTPVPPFVGAAVPDEAIAAAGLAAAAAAIGAAGLGLASAARPLIEKSPREGGLVSVDPWDDDATIAAPPHDVVVHGEGTAEVNPRHADGASGELEFPAAVVGATGLAAAGLAAVGLDSVAETTPVETPAVPTPASAVVDDRTVDDRTTIAQIHEPITQLPPDEYEPLETDYAINPAFLPEYNLEAETIEEETPAASFSNLPSPTAATGPSPTAAALGAAALGLAGIAGLAGIGSAGVAAAGNPGSTPRSDLSLDGVDDGLPELPEGYGDSRIVLMARDPQWCYTYWDAPNDDRQALRNQGGQQFALRLYDVTDLDLTTQKPHSLQQYACDETARDWYLAIPVSDRDYMAEIGYVTAIGGWLVLARSNSVRIPPVYPSDWQDDQFKAIEWDDQIVDSIFLQLVPPGQTLQNNPQSLAGPSNTPSAVFGLSQTAENLRISGSFYGSQNPTDSLSSFTLPSEERGGWSLPTLSGMGVSEMSELSGLANLSGIGMSGIGMSGIGMPRVRSRKFWLVADAELIVYGATEPDAQVTIGGVPIQLSPDGTFRIQMSFQDGILDFPIMAIASDGEQMRQVKLTFNRSTTLRHTNTPEEAQDELF